MKKFTFIGAGSLDFTKDLVRDILTFEAFRDAELMLMDIDPKRLEYAVKGVQKIVDAGKYPANQASSSAEPDPSILPV